MRKEREYPGLIHKEPESNYGISFPDFPGCISSGSSLEETYKLAKEALQFHVDGMIEDGEPIPSPSSLDIVGELRETLNALVILTVPVVLPARSKRINLTIDENLLDEIDVCASTLGKSRSAFIADAARMHLMLGKG